MEPILAITHYLMIFATVALLVVASGLMRVFLGDVAPAVWGANHAFWTKMGLFLCIGVLSVFPSLRYLGWKKAFAATGALPQAADRKQASLFVHIQLGLFVFIPVMAVLMAEAAEH